MISIKPSCLPKYLKRSALFENLGGDDEEVSVPKDCCKLDTSVTNAADLDGLLRTLRFWGVDQFPSTVIEFLIMNDRAVWEPVTVNFVTDMPMVAEIVRVAECEREKQVCEAASLRNADLVTCLLEHGCPAEYPRPYQQYQSVPPLSKFISAVDIAAKNGDLEILKVLTLHNCKYSEGIGRLVVLGGHYECLEFVMQNGCPAAKDLISCAFAGGSSNCLRYVHETLKCLWPNNIFSKLLVPQWTNESEPGGVPDEQSLLQCLEYAQAHNCPHDPKGCETCAVYGYFQLLKRLHEHGCPWDKNTVENAARFGHVDCLVYAIEQGCPHTDKLMWAALCSGKVEVIQYLHSRGEPMPEDILRSLGKLKVMRTLVLIHNIEMCIEHAYKLGYTRDPDICYYASEYGWYDILVDSHKHGFEWGEECSGQAASGGHLDCLIYLHENGCPWDDRSADNALQNKHFDCFTYAVEHGCPVTSYTFNYAVSSGSADMVQYLHDRGVAWPDDILSGIYWRVSEHCEDASNVKAAVCLALAYKLGCPYDPDTCLVASKYGWYDILVDAHQHGCEISQDCIYAAGNNCYDDCVQYLIDHG